MVHINYQWRVYIYLLFIGQDLLGPNLYWSKKSDLKICRPGPRTKSLGPGPRTLPTLGPGPTRTQQSRAHVTLNDE